MPIAAESTRIHFPTIIGLAHKIANELSHPQQLLHPERRKMLVRNARTMLAGSVYRPNVTTRDTEHRIINERTKHITSSGIPFYLVLNSEFKIATHIFTGIALPQYIPPSEGNISQFIRDKSGVIALLPGTTVQFGSSENTSRFRIPSEGFIDYRGNLQQFMVRSRDSAKQHGGIYITNDYKDIKIVPHAALVKLQSNTFSPGQALFEANWYMDSDNQYKVCNRPNLRAGKVYNCIGELSLQDDSTIFFTISTYFGALVDALRETGNKDQELSDPCLCTMRTIAAMCNVLAKEEKATSWKVCGLEYNGGGLRTSKEILENPPNRDCIIFTSARRR